MAWRGVGGDDDACCAGRKSKDAAWRPAAFWRQKRMAGARIAAAHASPVNAEHQSKTKLLCCAYTKIAWRTRCVLAIRAPCETAAACASRDQTGYRADIALLAYTLYARLVCRAACAAHCRSGILATRDTYLLPLPICLRMALYISIMAWR